MSLARIAVLAVSSAAGAIVQQAPTFRADTRVVPIYATVIGPDGRLLPALARDQFVVFDNGKPQPITTFSNRPIPITIVALWDVSTSMTRHADRSRAVARAFVDALWPDDRLRFGTFGEEIALSPLVTGDKRTLHRIVDEEIWFRGPTPMWTAIEQGLVLLSGEANRRVLVVMGDAASTDNHRKPEVLTHLQRADVMAYSIGLEGSGIAGDLRQITDQTGGGHAQLKKTADLDAELARVLNELHHQYLIGFTPAVLDGVVHRLVVRTTIDGAKVRARTAYVASRGR